MTGTGPYNAWLDPLTINDWQQMAFNEIQHMTADGVPGVWTHGFFDGWGVNYMAFSVEGHNAIGRFYETFGNHVPSTEDRVVRRMSDRAWFRPNPPLPKVRWSLRDNVNYQESGALLALADTAAMVCYGVLGAMLRGRVGHDANDLLKGLPGLASAVPVEKLWALSRDLRADPGLLALCSRAPAEEVLARLRADAG